MDFFQKIKVMALAGGFALTASAASALSIQILDDATDSVLAFGSGSPGAVAACFDDGFGSCNGLDVTIASGSDSFFSPEDSLTSTVTVNEASDGGTGSLSQTGIVRVEVSQTYDNTLLSAANFLGVASTQVFGLDSGVTSELYLTENSTTLFDTSGTQLLSADFNNQNDASSGDFDASFLVKLLIDTQLNS